MQRQTAGHREPGRERLTNHEKTLPIFALPGLWRARIAAECRDDGKEADIQVHNHYQEGRPEEKKNGPAQTTFNEIRPPAEGSNGRPYQRDSGRISPERLL